MTYMTYPRKPKMLISMMMGMMLMSDGDLSLLQLSALLLKMDDKKREEFCRQGSGFIV